MMIGRSVETIMAEREDNPTSGEPLMTVNELAAEPGLRGATFTLHAGEILGVAALQGHGQFELFTALFGARRATGGTITVDGEQVHLDPRTTRSTRASASIWSRRIARQKASC